MAHAPSVLDTPRLMEEVCALSEALGANRSPWLTAAQAAEYLNVWADTLKRPTRKHRHVDGGPVDVREGRKLLRGTGRRSIRGSGGLRGSVRRG